MPEGGTSTPKGGDRGGESVAMVMAISQCLPLVSVLYDGGYENEMGRNPWSIWALKVGFFFFWFSFYGTWSVREPNDAAYPSTRPSFVKISRNGPKS
ncbi:hypothetical protein F5X98DRAFT_45469 [Xylaria grammica]|nr:hypothetical protein F5X98DRAFT_45469 [Xylaria grammica]